MNPQATFNQFYFIIFYKTIKLESFSYEGEVKI